MKIFLVSVNTATMPYPVYPLGLGVVAAALERHGHEAVVFDALGQDMAALRAALAEHRPGLVGIAIRNLDNANMVHEQLYTGMVAEAVRCVRETCAAPVVLGGAGYSLAPESLLRQAGADYGIVGEGEALAVALAEAVSRGSPPPPGTILRAADGGHLPGSEIAGARYDASLLTAYLKAGSVIPLQTKRGCPHACIYCSYPALEGPALRMRPPAAVVDEMERLVHDHHVPFLFFTDSVFNDDQGLHLEILAEMRRRRFAVPWSAFFKPTGLTPETVRLMRETGLASAEMGSDGACDETLRGFRKPFRYRDVVAANDLLMDAGVAVAHYFIFGGPGETAETVRAGIANLRALRCSAAFVLLGLRILPRTGLAELAVREGVMAPGQDLLAPAYYCAPALDRAWLERTLEQAFAGLRHVIYPPDALDDKLQILHRLGYTGSLWELLGKRAGKSAAQDGGGT